MALFFISQIKKRELDAKIIRKDDNIVPYLCDYVWKDLANIFVELKKQTMIILAN